MDHSPAARFTPTSKKKNWPWSLANDALHMDAKKLCCQACQLNYTIQANEQTNKQTTSLTEIWLVLKFDSECKLPFLQPERSKQITH